MKRYTIALALGLGAASIAACVGEIGGAPAGPALSDQAADEVGATGMRRLSLDEYARTVVDLMGFTVENAREVMPADNFSPFDNDYTFQTPSESLVVGAEILAGDIADAVIADPALRSAVTGCEPSGVADETCFRSFITEFGRRALRRPLTDTEIDTFVTLLDHGVADDDFWFGVGAALRAFLQHPEFLYRVEVGEPVDGQPGVFRLNDYEIGTRLSYFLTGSTPPDWLLAAADAGELTTAAGISSAVAKLFEDDRARARINRFHAMWLGYVQLTKTGLSGDMHAESEALLERIIFDERRGWSDVLTSTETYLTPELATHYGLDSPGSSAGWVSYGDSGRQGIFSHASFLSVGAKFGDTSPTQRGKLIRQALFCETIPKPPPNLEVDVDEPPSVADPDACKQERYFMSHEEQCSGCHLQMDPIGFGLENYGADGVFRTTDIDRPDCPIDGDGEFVGLGTFNGPKELADLAVESGRVQACVIEQLYRFAAGHAKLDEHDRALVKRLSEEAASGGELTLDTFITAYATSDAFRHRREEATP